MSVNLTTVYCEFVKGNDLQDLIRKAQLPNDEVSMQYKVLE